MQNKMNSGLKFFSVITTCEKMVIPVAVSGEMEMGGVDRAVLRDGNGNMWTVGLLNDDGEWSFKEGWRRFYEDNSLKPYQFVVFNYKPPVFDFKILGENGCQILKQDDGSNNTDHDAPFFLSRLGLRKNELFIPKNVIINWKLKLPERLFLVDVQGNKWETVVKQWANGRVCCTGGAWRRLCKANNINMGDTYTCHFLLQGPQHPSILVRLAPTTPAPTTTKKGADKKKLVSNQDHGDMSC